MSGGSPASVPADLLACPDCRAPLGADLHCGSCERQFAADGSIPLLLPGAGASRADVQSFYEAHPFPDYAELDSPRVLRARAARSQFARLLDEQLPLEGAVLDAGCGTGQLTNFLALSRRTVVGLDFCLASLRLAAGFAGHYAIADAHFVQGDLLHPPLRTGAFASVVSLGALHHTADPGRAFTALTDVLAPGGHLVLGLYNRYGRAATKLRGLLIRTLGARRLARLDPILRRDRVSGRRRLSWLEDQYFNPLERTHTVDEVLGWFATAGLAYVNAVPKIVFGEEFQPDEPLFERGVAGSRLDHLLCQAGWAFTRGVEGGLFVLIGRKLRPAV